MSVAVARQMLGAEILKLRRKRGIVALALLFAAGSLVIFFGVRAAQHSSNPIAHEPAGGLHGFGDALRLLGLFMGPLAAILIGAEAGAADSAAGVFRDLVATGRSRLALFLVRVPAALAVCLTVVALGFGIAVAGTFLFAAGLPTPNGSTIAKSLGWVLLADGVVCVVAVGLASLTTSRPAALTALIGWQLVATPLLANATSLGSVRDGLLAQALRHFDPVATTDRGANVVMSAGVAVVVTVVWIAVFTAAGAWRTRTMDA